MRLAVSQIIVKRMEGLNLRYPDVSDKQKEELAKMKELLLAEE
jgi:hypothetical protein